MKSFEWNPKNSEANKTKHGVDFPEASTIFFDPFALTASDGSHSGNEYRDITIGLSEKSRVLIVVTTVRGQNLRIISARRATPRERQLYAEAIKDTLGEG